MGVRGLTTYIAKHSERFFKIHELHDTYLVIDGNNLAAQLYKWHGKCYDCFGGDYDVYAKVITDFFDILKKCNITAVVIFDGSYENKKLKTIYGRVQNRYESTRRCCAATESTTNVFPLFLRELFTETVVKLGVKAMRCDFEADYEMACIARTLNCPILSYDSDFYIFDVLYVPFNTLVIQSKRGKDKAGKGYFFVECRLYKVDNFLNSLGGMPKENLPLLAVLLGNDYIKPSVFTNFYSELKLTTKKSMQSDQQRKIESVIRWLRNETYESAAKKILGRVKGINRKKVAEQIKEVAEGYICAKSQLLPYLDIPYETSNITPQAGNNLDIDADSIPDENQDDDSEEDNDSDVEMDGEEVAIEPDMLNEHFPAWFLKEYRGCVFPAWFVDIAVHNRYFFIPQVDNFQDKHSHEISVGLLAHLHRLLTSGKKRYFTYVARCENGRVRNTKLQTSVLDLPALDEIASMDEDARKAVLFKILNFDEDVHEVLKEYPPEWHVFVLSIMYWVQNSEKRVLNNHVYALIMCALQINVVDPKIGYCRNLKFVQKFEHDFTSKPDADEADDKGISKRDCVHYLKEMITHFFMDEKMCRMPRLYDLHTVDAFARFQSCLFHIKYLNKALDNPFTDFFVSQLYNGTCAYNVFCNLNRRADTLAYLRNLLNNAKGMLGYFERIAGVLTAKIDTVNVSTAKKRRKRKNRNKSESEVESKVMCVEQQSDDEEKVYDANNKYSMLNFV